MPSIQDYLDMYNKLAKPGAAAPTVPPIAGSSGVKPIAFSPGAAPKTAVNTSEGGVTPKPIIPRIGGAPVPLATPPVATSGGTPVPLLTPPVATSGGTPVPLLTPTKVTGGTPAASNQGVISANGMFTIPGTNTTMTVAEAASKGLLKGALYNSVGSQGVAYSGGTQTGDTKTDGTQTGGTKTDTSGTKTDTSGTKTDTTDKSNHAANIMALIASGAPVEAVVNEWLQRYQKIVSDPSIDKSLLGDKFMTAALEYYKKHKDDASTETANKVLEMVKTFGDALGLNTPTKMPDVLTWDQALAQAKGQVDPEYDIKKQQLIKDLQRQGVSSGLISQLPWQMFEAENQNTLENQRLGAMNTQANSLISQNKSEYQNAEANEQNRKNALLNILTNAYSSAGGTKNDISSIGTAFNNYFTTSAKNSADVTKATLENAATAAGITKTEEETKKIITEGKSAEIEYQMKLLDASTYSDEKKKKLKLLDEQIASTKDATARANMLADLEAQLKDFQIADAKLAAQIGGMSLEKYTSIVNGWIKDAQPKTVSDGVGGLITETKDMKQIYADIINRIKNEFIFPEGQAAETWKNQLIALVPNVDENQKTITW